MTQQSNGTLRRRRHGRRSLELSAADIEPTLSSVPDDSDWRQIRGSQDTPLRTLAVLLLSAGVVVLTSSLLREVSQPAGQIASLLLLWAGLFGAAIYATVGMRPVGILRFRGSDVVWALAVATLFRLALGVVHGAETLPFPTASVSASESLADWAVTNFMSAGLAGPFVEESFFRMALIPVIFTLLVPRLGSIVGGAFAALVSAAGFAALHIAYNAPDAGSAVEFFVLGLLCSSLVLLTGRIWGAVLLHVSYNVAFLAVSAAGFILS